MGSIIEESKKSKGIRIFKITKKRMVILITIFLILISSYFYFNKEDTKETSVSQKELTVRKDDLKISIEADGRVVAEDGVELSFSVSGNNLEVKEVFVKEGDKIKKGDKIATVKTETLELNVRTVYSSYLSALADYNQTMDGATDKQIADAKDGIVSAEISFDQAKISLEDTKQSAEESIQSAKDDIYDAENSLKDAEENLNDNKDELSSEDVNDAYESLVDNIKSANISLDSVLKESDEIIGVDDKCINDDFESVLGARSSSSLNQAKDSYVKSRDELEKLNSSVILLNFDSSYNEINIAANQAVLVLREFEEHLYYMKLMMEATITFSGLSQTNINSFMSTIISNRTAINTKITSLNTKIEAVDDAKDSLSDYITDYEDAKRDLDNANRDLANVEADTKRSIENSEATLRSRELSVEQKKRDYSDLITPLTVAEKASARSRLTGASVSLEKSQNELKNATIFSPIDGEIAMLNYKTGDIIIDNSSSDPVAVIINNDTLFIEVDIEEADINKIKIGQVVYADFDALDNIKLDGEVSFISLTSKTNNNGIVTYLVRIVIMNKGDNQIREGMTALVDFVTAEAKDILIIPVSAVKNVDDKPSVLNNNKEWVPVTTGFTDGKNVEIIKGLNAGDKIVY